MGGILGSFCAGLILIPILGAGKALILLATINLILGIYFMRKAQFVRPYKNWKYIGSTFVVVVLFLTYGFKSTFFVPVMPDGYKQLFYQEGAGANVGVYQSIVLGREYVKILKVNGVYQSGGTDKHAMIVQRRQGHLPMLLHDQPDSVLMIGLATGVTLSAIAEHNKVKYIDCVELIPSQYNASLQFELENRNVLSDSRVNVIIDDGRSYIKTSSVKYKLIIGDLFQMTSAGTSTMYSLEHITACKNHLSDGGIMVQYIPLQQISEENLKSIIKSFLKVFPFVQTWISDISGKKPVLAIAASLKMIRLNTSLINDRIGKSTAITLDSVGYDNSYLFINQCVLQTETVRKYAGNASLITLDRPTIEFSAPRIFTVPKDQRIRLIMTGLLDHMRPLRIEVPNDNSDEILRELNIYLKANKSNIIAVLAISVQNWNAAEKLLKETIELIPDHFDTRRILARTHVFIAIELLQRKQVDKAIDRLNKAKELGIDDVLVEQLLDASKAQLTGKKIQLPNVSME